MAIPKNRCGVRPVSRLVAKNTPIMGREVATPNAMANIRITECQDHAAGPAMDSRMLLPQRRNKLARNQHQEQRAGNNVQQRRARLGGKVRSQIGERRSAGKRRGFECNQPAYRRRGADGAQNQQRNPQPAPYGYPSRNATSGSTRLAARAGR